ncbi:MAG: sulfite exporter TauE/SafE family protein, partial [Bacteroidales bacterium]|nr:sulfite exporter TauE/SafE family protein [Bacteroidales bacterium]
GFINTFAGSGSLLTLPVLMFMGLPPTMANGTNRIGILLQSIVSVRGFKKHKTFAYKESVLYIIPAIAGSVVGAVIAVDSKPKFMYYCITGMLVFMFLIVLFKPDQWIKSKAGEVLPKPGIWQLIIFFFIGVYGGFVQAGVGFFLLAGLVLGAGADLVKSNGIKNFIVLAYTPIALAVFIFSNEVDYTYGLVLAAGNMTGAYIATRLIGLKNINGIIRYVLLLALSAAIVKMMISSV